MYYPWWGRWFLAIWNCKWKELWSPGVWCSPLGCTSESQLAHGFQYCSSGWSVGEQILPISSTLVPDYFHLYSKAFSPSCACKSQNSSLFLWLGLSMNTEAARVASSSERTVALVSRRVLCNQWNLCNPALVKGESVLKSTKRICDNAQSSASDGFGWGLAKLLEVVGGSPVSCWNESWKDQCVSQDLVDICVPDAPGSHS